MKFKDLLKKVSCCTGEDSSKPVLEELPDDDKPDDDKPADGKQDDGKPADGKPNDDKPADGKPSPKKPSATAKPSTPRPAKLRTALELEVLNKDDYARLKALGLGRGVDGTDPTPWRNKGSFQVRQRIDGDTVVGTDEGGYCRRYVDEVSSVLSQQTKLNASITIPKSPVDIGIDAEYSRSFTETRKAEGVKIVTRTISFKTDFEDVVLREYHACKERESGSTSDEDSPKSKPMSHTATGGSEPPPTGGSEPPPIGGSEPPPTEGLDPNPTGGLDPTPSPTMPMVTNETDGGQTGESPAGEKEESPESEADSQTEKSAEGNEASPQREGDGSEAKTDSEENAIFEERLSTWLMEQLQQKYSGETLQSLLKKSTCERSGKEIRRYLKAICTDFVNCFSVTHYVSAVHLGAVEYRVVGDKEYIGTVGVGASAGIKKIATSEFKHSTNWKKFKKYNNIETIGVFTKADQSANPRLIVQWRTEAEAVVGVQVQPISNLVRHPILQKILQEVLLQYMSDRGDTKFGPFLIAFNDDQEFLDVNAAHQLTATTKPEAAAKFHIVPTVTGKRDEFFIIHKGTSNLLAHGIKMDAVPRHLDTKVYGLGRHPAPLSMVFNAKEHHSRLTLQSRIVTRLRVDPSSWVKGDDIFYIKCARRWWSINGYLCIERNEPQGAIQQGVQYATKCVTRTQSHDDANSFMLFRLIPEEKYKDMKS